MMNHPMSPWIWNIEGNYWINSNYASFRYILQKRRNPETRVFFVRSTLIWMDVRKITHKIPILFQVVGKHGRGITELLDVPRDEIDLIVGSLEHSFATIGGFCAGTHFIVEHQRLSGLGMYQQTITVHCWTYAFLGRIVRNLSGVCWKFGSFKTVFLNLFFDHGSLGHFRSVLRRKGTK